LVISDVSICNSALIKLGADRIISLSDDTKSGRVCREQYPKLKEDLLKSHPWNFAITRESLAELTGYDPLFNFERVFALPSDYLRVLDTDLNINLSVQEEPWAIESHPISGQRVLLCNASTVNIKFIQLVNEARFSVDFAELLALYLAQDLAYAITQNATLSGQLLDKFTLKQREVRSFDGQESSVQQIAADDWLTARL
jgi:hypothetical protein